MEVKLAESLILKAFYDIFIWKAKLDDKKDPVSTLTLSGLNMIDPEIDFLCYYAKKRKWTQVTSLDLSNNWLTRIPDFSQIFPNLEILCLQKNQIKEIPDFASLPKLENINLSDNLLTEIPDFSGLPCLKTLEVESNRLLCIPNFSRIPDLECLSIYNNKITKVPDFTLPNLVTLRVSKNQVTTLPNLTGCPALINFSASQNLITDISILTHCRHLEKLYLSNSKITSVPDFDLPNLSHLYIDGNEIREIPNFSHLSKLRVLDLNRNLLRKVPDLSALEELRLLYLVKNYLTEVPLFHTYLKNLIKVDLTRNRVSVPKSWPSIYTCEANQSTPEEVARFFLHDLTSEEDLKMKRLDEFLQKFIATLTESEKEEVKRIFAAAIQA